MVVEIDQPVLDLLVAETIEIAPEYSALPEFVRANNECRGPFDIQGIGTALISDLGRSLSLFRTVPAFRRSHCQEVVVALERLIERVAPGQAEIHIFDE